MKTKLKKYLKRFKELQGSPNYLAKGVAIGVFIGFAPLLPLKTILIVTLSLVLSGSTVAGILSCTVICNPITYLPLYYIAWWVGDLLLPGRASWEQLEICINAMNTLGIREALMLVAETGFDTGLVMLAGGTIIALPLAILSYPLAYQGFLKLAKERQKKQLLNNE